jgi:hypothetical protein
MGVYVATPPTIANGEIVDGAKLTQFTDFMKAVMDPWTPYTVTWTAGAGTPSVGNGTLSGWYRRLGKTVDHIMILLAGSTTTFGTAGTYWLFSLPPSVPVARVTAIHAFAIDTGVKEWPMVGAIGYDSTSVAGAFLPAGGRMLTNSPFTFGSTDKLIIGGTYETT